VFFFSGKCARLSAVALAFALFPSLAFAQSAASQTSSNNQNTNQTANQNTDQNTQDGQDDQDNSDTTAVGSPTLFPHPDDTRWWISGQINVIFQAHRTFPAKYSGPNSMTAPGQSATTHIMTLYTGYELTHTTEVFGDLEFASGGGIGSANGLAGYTNLDAVRTVQGVPLAEVPYIARLMIRQIIPLSKKYAPEDRDPLHLATSVPVRRIEFRVGKYSLADFFDANTWGSDSHYQFMNWTTAQDGAYDYAANTRGYTDGAMIEYYDHWFTARYSVALESKIANGDYLDADIARARSENVEFDAQGRLIPHRMGTIRLLSYLNTADMGDYKEAVEDFLDHETDTTVPSIIDTRRQGRRKYGFGVNVEQSITPWLGAFGRFGWSDGRNESWAYTEDDCTGEVGLFAPGQTWHRKNDSAGFAFVTNGIAKYHQEYLMLGGLGFLLGDGNLHYGRENIEESYYNIHLWRGFYGAFDVQHINNPGYNQDRGPIMVYSLRAHLEL
jgi:high affinity Mn2+ porin